MCSSRETRMEIQSGFSPPQGMSRSAIAHNRGLRVIAAQGHARQRAFGGVVVDLDVSIFT